MKTLAFLFVTAAASLAFAYPSVKDQAVFKGTYQGGAGGSIDFVQALELTALNEATGMFTLTSTINVNGRTQSEEAQVSKGDLPDSAKIQDIMTNCASYGGEAVEITVPAGTFTACYGQDDKQGETWISDVPFGIVKQISFDEDQNKMVIELQSFRSGN